MGVLHGRRSRDLDTQGNIFVVSAFECHIVAKRFRILWRISRPESHIPAQ